MKESFAKLAIWKIKLTNVDQALLPSSIPRPNPLIVDSMLFMSVFSPGAVCCLDRDTGALVWRRELSGFGADCTYFAAGKLFAKSSHTLYALAPESGRKMWHFCPYGPAGEWIYSHPIVSRDRLFIGDRRGCLHCLDANSGRHIWVAQTNRKKADANSTPVVADGLVIVGTNARTAVAFDVTTGRRAWKRNVDGPAAFGLLWHRGMVMVVTTESIYLISPHSGEVEQHLRWQGDSVDYVASAGRRFAAIMRGALSSTGNRKIFICDASRGVVATACHRVWCPTLRYVSECQVGYLSHLGGLKLLDRNTNTLADLVVSGEGVGVVDVKEKVIYAATERGHVYALRNPTAR